MSPDLALVTKHLAVPHEGQSGKAYPCPWGDICSTRPTELQGHSELSCRLSREKSAVQAGKADHKRGSPVSCSTRIVLEVPAMCIAEPTAPAQQHSVFLLAEAELLAWGPAFPCNTSARNSIWVKSMEVCNVNTATH